MTEQQKQNLANILRLAQGHLEVAKKKAVESGDFNASMRIASNEAKVESYFRAHGVEVKGAE